MNSNYGKNFDFDLGIGSSRNKSLNDQKNKTSSYSSTSSSYSSAQSKPAWQPNKPSWTHQPAAPTQPALPGGAPSSMTGDIFGKSWSSSNPSSGVGIVDKNPNLFGDLVNSALGQGKTGNSNVSLRNSTPAATTNNKSSFSMGNMADSLPKSTASTGNPGVNWGGSPMNYGSNVGTNTNRGANLGTPAMKSGNVGGGIGGIGGGGIGSKSKDPFGSLVDFGSNPVKNLNLAAKTAKPDSSGEFQNPPKPSASPFPTSGHAASSNNFPGSANPSPSFNMDDFAKPASGNTFSGSTNPSPSFNMDDFAKPASGNAFSGSTNPSPSFNFDDFAKPTTQVPTRSSTGDPLDMLFTPSNDGFEGGQQQQSDMDDWGMEAEFGGDSGGPTTELDGLPPPPAGVNASAAKNKGMDSYKQGQYADAIKWLSWAVVLLEKAGDNGIITEVLSSRASCYKEVGEYKKAVADCTKVLEKDDANVLVLVQRALLYESMEKYRLGAEDLRAVLKVDPGNRIARSTVHRLSKLAD